MEASINKISAVQVWVTFLGLLLLPALVLFLSGDWLWLEGWLFGAWFMTLCVSAILYLYRNDPALLAERYKKPGDGSQEVWDVFLVIGINLGFLAWLVLIPLDAKRFTWSPVFPLWVKLLGIIFMFGCFFLMYRSYVDNTYLSALVRIQADRQHKVVSTGVYGFVRHPMYLGGSLLFLGVPLLLGSLVGVLIGILMILIIAGRIIGEEKMLIEELEGYTEYQRKVRYRLIPYVW